VRRLGLLLLIGCSSSSASPDASTAFEYTATAGWVSLPDVTSVTIDGLAVASGETYTVDEAYASYEVALAAPLHHPVVVTTSTDTLTFQLVMQSWPCMNWMLDAPVTKQAEQFSLGVGLDGRLGFGAYSGSCESSDGRVIGWAARTP
jgi:hypothetical protein